MFIYIFYVSFFNWNLAWSFMEFHFMGDILGIHCCGRKIFKKKISPKVKIPKFLSWLFIMFLWLISMVFFRTNNLHECKQYFQSIFGLSSQNSIGFSVLYFIHKYELFILLTGLIAMTPIGKSCYLRVKQKISENVFLAMENFVTLLLLGISILYVVTGTYNPFIYFQF